MRRVMMMKVHYGIMNKLRLLWRSVMMQLKEMNRKMWKMEKRKKKNLRKKMKEKMMMMKK